MSTGTIPSVAPVTFMMKDKLRAEAAVQANQLSVCLLVSVH